MGFFSFIYHFILDLFGMADNFVFLSFSNEETGKNFSDHLNTALTRAGVHTLKRNNGTSTGENAGLTKNAIEKSKISVIVFSKAYASSTKCLDELVMIMDARRTAGHMVLPIFYRLKPSEVRNQREGYGQAISEHEKTFSMERVQQWRAALKEAAELKGEELGYRREGEQNEPALDDESGIKNYELFQSHFKF